MACAEDGLLRVQDTGPVVGGLDEIRILCPEPGEVLFRLPVPDAVAGKDKVHLFQCPLVGFGIERPYDDDAGEVDAAEDVEGFLIKLLEDRR